MASAGFNAYLTGEEGWQDLTADFITGNTNPANEPIYDDIGNGIFLPNFAVGDIAFLNFHIKHDILIGSKIYPHIHFAPITAMSAGETIVWEFGYVAAERASGDPIDAALTTLTLTYTATGTEVAHEHLVVEVSDVDSFVTPDVDAMLVSRVTRGTGTYASGVYGITADIHYQVGRISTPNKASPFVN